MKKLTPISRIALAVALICIIYYCVCGIIRSFGTSGLWIWLVFGLMLLSGCIWKSYVEPQLSKGRLVRAYKTLKAVVLTVFILFMVIFFVFEGFLIKEWSVGHRPVDKPVDVVMILGATVEYDRPGEILEERIDTAVKLIKDNPHVTVIACGGLGEGDIITEAQCIKDALISEGIKETQIFMEDSSTSTAENFSYATSLFTDDTRTVAVITSGFHQLRTMFTASTVFEKQNISGVSLVPVSAPCLSITLPCNMVREFAAFTRNFMTGDIYI